MFNKASRVRNAIRLSTLDTVCYVIRNAARLVFRMLFVRYLAVNYLGINGLFSNILQVLSLADLGLIECINFRFYEPIHRGDAQRVGQLLRYMKTVYRMVAIIFTIAGLLLLPFLTLVIKDAGEIPPDVDLYVVYCLFLFNSVSTYFFSYSQTLLVADQRGYVKSVYSTVVNLLNILVRILIVRSTRNYTLMIGSMPVITIITNILLHRYIVRSYREVFSCREALPAAERKQILKDARNVLVHKLGGVVQNGTDNILITAFSGLVSCGLFSNYSLLFSSVSMATGSMIKSVAAGVGNARAAMDKKAFFTLYRRMQLIDFYISGLCTTGLFVLAADFIALWLGREFVMDDLIVWVLCLDTYVIDSRMCNWNFVNVTGLITKDILRPVLFVSINLIVSVVLGRVWGIVGVLTGTIVGNLCVNLWREARLLYREVFVSESFPRYWLSYGLNVLITVAAMLSARAAFRALFPGEIGIIQWIAGGVLSCAIFTALFCLAQPRQTRELIRYFAGRRRGQSA